MSSKLPKYGVLIGVMASQAYFYQYLRQKQPHLFRSYIWTPFLQIYYPVLLKLCVSQ